MAETYTLTLRNSAPWVGCENKEEYPLSDFGYSDEDWDSLSQAKQGGLLEEWAEEEFWNAGYEYSGEVQRG